MANTIRKEIVKVSLIDGGDGGVSIKYLTYDEEGLIGSSDKDYKRVPSDTFKQAMQKLRTHYTLILEFMDPNKFQKFKPLADDDVVAKNFRICGFSISGEQASAKESVMIFGFRTLSNGLGSSLNTPNTRVQNEGETAYKFIKELMLDLDDVKAQAKDYLAGKHTVRPGKQVEMFSAKGLDGDGDGEEGAGDSKMKKVG